MARAPGVFDISPDGTELWVAHSRDGGVSVIDIASLSVAHTLDLRTKRSNRLRFASPDGALVLISDLDAGELVVVDAGARVEVKRLPLGRSPEGILVEPGGARAYVAVTGDNVVAVVDIQGPAGRRPNRDRSWSDGMAWVGR